MPPRSNIFQRLVASIHDELAPAWNVAESGMLEDSVTHGLREVDIVLTTRLAGHALRIGIECRDRSRPADVNWVEAMAKKHEHLPTDKLVLWSATGFSKAAAAKASFLNISAVSQVCAIPVAWKALARELIGGRLRYLTPIYSCVVDVVSPDGTPVRHEANPAFHLRELTGTSECTLGGLMQMLVALPELPTLLLDHAPDGAGEFHGVFSPPTPCELLNPDGKALGVISRVLMGIRTVVEESDLEIRTANYEGKVYSLAEAELSKGRFEVRITEARDKTPSVRATFRKSRGSGSSRR